MTLLFVEVWGMGDVIQVLPTLRSLKALSDPPRVIFLTRQPEILELLGKGLVDEIEVPSIQSRIGFLALLYRLRRKKLHAVFLNQNSSCFWRWFIRCMMRTSIVRGAQKLPLLKLKLVEHQSEEWFSMVRELYPKLQRVGTPEVSRLREGNLALHLGSGKNQKYKRIPRVLIEPVLDELLQRIPRILLIEGPEDRGTGNWIIKKYPTKVLLISPRTVANLSEVFKTVSILVTGDTGLGHLATFLGIPVLTVAGPTNFNRTAPWGNRVKIVRHPSTLKCQPCHGTIFSSICPNRKCLTQIKPTEVLQQISSMITAISHN